MTRPPLPPFDRETAKQKVRLAEDAWNTRDPEKVAGAFTVDSRWRNRAELVTGREDIVAFLTRNRRGELEHRLIKELWAFEGNRIAVRFAEESHDDYGNWFRPRWTRPGPLSTSSAGRSSVSTSANSSPSPGRVPQREQPADSGPPPLARDRRAGRQRAVPHQPGGQSPSVPSDVNRTAPWARGAVMPLGSRGRRSRE